MIMYDGKSSYDKTSMGDVSGQFQGLVNEEENQNER
jgi:hypothetical protein